MILATVKDVEDRLAPEPDFDEELASILLEEASVMVEEYLGLTYADGDTVPRAVSIVVSRMVSRRLTSNTGDVPDGVSSLQATDYQASFAEPFVSSGLWLNRRDKMMLRRYRVASAVSVPLQSERY